MISCYRLLVNKAKARTTVKLALNERLEINMYLYVFLCSFKNTDFSNLFEMDEYELYTSQFYISLQLNVSY